jgi:two-component system, NtrC family, response regulator HydG
MTKTRVLIVDDDRDMADSLAFIIRRRGHEVTVAYDGESAVELFDAHDFDLAFLDVLLPGMNGVESFLAIRRNHPEAKIYMMTGYAPEELVRVALDGGALGALRKPVFPEDILSKLGGAERRSVLIADDDHDFAQALSSLLGRAGWKCSVVNNGQETLDAFTKQKFDALVVDFHMPILTGLEVVLDLKRQGIKVPTLMVTAYAEELDPIARAEVQGLLSKPIDPRYILALIENASAPRAAA